MFKIHIYFSIGLLSFAALLSNAKPGFEILLFFSIFMLALSSAMITLCLFQALNVVCQKKKVLLAMCLTSGFMDCSIAVFSLFLAAYDFGWSLATITWTYGVGSFLFLFIATILLFPSKSETLSVFENEAKRNGVKMKFKRLQQEDKVELNNHRDNYKETSKERIPLITKGKMKSETTLFECIFSWLTITCVLFNGIILLKLFYFVGNLDKYLLIITDRETAATYTKVFGYIQFLNLISASMAVLLFRGTECKEKNISPELLKIKEIRGCILPSLVLICGVLLMDGLMLFNQIYLIVPIFLLQLSADSLVFCFMSIFAKVAFPSKHFCSTYGFIISASGLLLLLQYPILSLELDIFYGNQFWINLMFEGLCLIPLVHPMYLWHYCKKEELKLKSIFQV